MKKIWKFIKENFKELLGIISVLSGLALIFFKVVESSKRSAFMDGFNLGKTQKSKSDSDSAFRRGYRNGYSNGYNKGTSESNKKSYDKGYNDAMNDNNLHTGEEMDNRCKKSYGVGRIHENNEFVEKTRDLANEMYDKGVEAGYNTPGSETFKYSMQGYSKGLKEGIEEGVNIGKTMSLLNLREPGVDNPEQCFLKDNFNVRVVKDGKDNFNEKDFLKGEVEKLELIKEMKKESIFK